MFAFRSSSLCLVGAIVVLRWVLEIKDKKSPSSQALCYGNYVADAFCNALISLGGQLVFCDCSINAFGFTASVSLVDTLEVLTHLLARGRCAEAKKSPWTYNCPMTALPNLSLWPCKPTPAWAWSSTSCGNAGIVVHGLDVIAISVSCFAQAIKKFRFLAG